MIDVELDIPERPNGLEWHVNHRKAARLRAQGVAWEQVAEKIGVTNGTARNYQTVEGFEHLVRYFTALLHQAEYQQMMRQKYDIVVHGETAALATLLEIANDEKARNRDRIDAAYKFLDSIGTVAKNRALGTYYGELMRQGRADESAVPGVIDVTADE